APTSGSMGYGLPAAVAAQRISQDRRVVCLAGDGCFMMHGQEFATAVQYGLPILVILIDNGMFGTIRMHQERRYPGRVSATALRNPDFAAYARAFGGHGERVEQTEDFAPALRRALDSGLPSILHCLLDPEAITPTTTLSRLRQGACRPPDSGAAGAGFSPRPARWLPAPRGPPCGPAAPGRGRPSARPMSAAPWCAIRCASAASTAARPARRVPAGAPAGHRPAPRGPWAADSW